MGRRCPRLESEPSHAAHPILPLLGSINVPYCSDVALRSIPDPDVQERGRPRRERGRGWPASVWDPLDAVLADRRGWGLEGFRARGWNKDT